MMRYIVKFLVIGILCVFFNSAFATTTDNLTQLLNNIQTMQADFSQTISDMKGKKIHEAQGKMSLARPGKFRWDVMHPNQQLIVTDGKKIWIYDQDLEQLTVRYFTKEAGEVPALLLSHANTTLVQDFQVQMTRSSELQWFLLKPKNKNNMFEVIKLGFANQQIKQMQLQDHLGHMTMVQFTHITMNKNLPSSLFNFKAPAHVDVVDETHR